jgi:hypothetical protein
MWLLSLVCDFDLPMRNYVLLPVLLAIFAGALEMDVFPNSDKVSDNIKQASFL